MKSQLLISFAYRYWATRDASIGWQNQLRYVVVHFSKFIGRPATFDDLTVDNVNAWIAEMCASKLSKQSCRSKRRVLLVLWRAAADRDLAPMLPERKIRKVKAPPLIPKAWTADEMRRLIATCRELRGPRNGDFPARFWLAFVLVAYNTGLRLSDLVRLRFDDIGADGGFTIIQQKTGFPVTCHLKPATLAAVANLAGRGDRIFAYHLQTMQAQFKHIVRRAGLVGSIKTLRRTAATLCECATPGSASALLGHRDPALAVRHYLDPRQVQASKALPPELFEQGGAA